MAKDNANSKLKSLFDCIKRVYSSGNMIKDNPNSKIKEPITIKYICKFILTFIIMQSTIFILTPIWIIFMIYMFRLENLLVMKFIFLLINGVM